MKNSFRAKKCINSAGFQLQSMAMASLWVLWFLTALVTTGAAEEAANGSSVSTTRPSVVNVGALFTYNSIIGRAAMLGIQQAVKDVNANPSILSGTRLNVITQDTNCSGFLGTIEGESSID